MSLIIDDDIELIDFDNVIDYYWFNIFFNSDDYYFIEEYY